MKLISFVADSAATALAEVHKRLGPDAVIVSVRPIKGISRLWQHGFEVTAGVPDKTSAPNNPVNSSESSVRDLVSSTLNAAPQTLNFADSAWRSIAWLEANGLLSVHAGRLQTHLRQF